MRRKLALGSLFVLATAASAQAQRTSPDAFEAWKQARGDSWRLHSEDRTLVGLFLYGGAAEPSLAPREDGDYFVLARELLAETRGLHGVDPTTLVEDAVTFLPLGAVGSSDKQTVRLVQEVNGVAVLGGSVNVLFDMAGRMLSLDVQALPGLAAFPTEPTLGEAAARALAEARFKADAGVEPSFLGAGRLVIARNPVGEQLQPRLVWEVNAQWSVPGFDQEGWYYRIDAATGELVQREASIHNLDVSGTVTSQVSFEHEPYNGANSVSENMAYINVTSAQGNAVTDVDGNFTIVGATEPVDVTISYGGTYAVTDNKAASAVEYSLTTTLGSASGNVVVMNPADTEEVTAEANSYSWIGKMRDWTLAVNPADTTWSGFQALANVNVNAACNATWGGTSINMFRSGGSCPNTSYSSIIVHEMGHWMNDLYGSGNGGWGFGEGNADVFSLYILDDPIVGKDFFGPGNDLRDANNSNLWCGVNCYGQNHENGEVLMGALWNVRANLKGTYGDAAGASLANTLFNAWMNAYDDGSIHPLIETHWLALDDDDGDINNGTPNYQDIDDGFTQQAFPGFPLTNSNYCTAGTSASGCQASIGSIGTASASAPNGFSLLATGVEGAKDGLFFFGTSGKQANPWGTGTSYQCVVPPVARAGLLTGSGTAGLCDGAFGQDLNALWCAACPKPNHNPGAGATVQAQLWYRDPQNTSNQTTSLSDAVEFSVAP